MVSNSRAASSNFTLKQKKKKLFFTDVMEKVSDSC